MLGSELTRRSVSLRVAVAGLVAGVLLTFTGVMLPRVSDVILLCGFAIVLVLASSSLASSARAGFIFALFALLGENVADFVYFVFAYGADISLLPYALGFILFVGRIPLFPLAGALGGYLGQEFFAEPGKRKGLREKSRKRSGTPKL